MSEKNIMIVDTVEALEKRIEEVREAQRIFSTYSQEQVDKIFAAAALAANKARIPLAKQAVAETGMGIVEDKVIKNHYASEYIYNAYKDTKTCGVIEEDKCLRNQDALLNRSVSLPRLFQQQILPPQRSLRL